MRTLFRNRRGASLLSYGLLVGLVGVVSLAAVESQGSSVASLFDRTSGALASGISAEVTQGASTPTPSPTPSPTPTPTPPPMSASVGSFSHSNGSNSFTVSWSGGSGYSNCILQQDSSSGFQNLGSVNCDSGSGTFSVTSPGSSWNGRIIRIAADSGTTALNTFGSLNCSTQSGSTSSTPSIDEDCNGNFNNTSSSNIWVASGSSGSVTDNGCSFGNYGTIGGSCSDCSGSAAFCIRNSDGTVSRICSGGGHGSRNYPSRAVCQLTTLHH